MPLATMVQLAVPPLMVTVPVVVGVARVGVVNVGLASGAFRFICVWMALVTPFTKLSSAAVVVATIINQGTESDQLLGFSVQGVQATLSGEVLLLPNKPLFFEGEQANAKAVFLGANPKPGTHVTISIGFAKAGFVTAEVIIRDKRDDFKNVISGAKLTTADTATVTE